MGIDSQYTSANGPDPKDFAASGYGLGVGLLVWAGVMGLYFSAAEWLYHHTDIFEQGHKLSGQQQIPFAIVRLGTPVVSVFIARWAGRKAQSLAATKMRSGAMQTWGDVLGIAAGGAIAVGVVIAIAAVAFIVLAVYFLRALIAGLVFLNYARE